MKKDSLIILSGGMDSITLLTLRQNEIALAISFNYGQKHKKELLFAKLACINLGIEHRIINLAATLKGNLKSNLLKTGAEIPDGHYEDKVMKKTVVPFRNGIMLSIAVGIAESEGLKKVMIANHAGDHAIYPDCRSEFINAISTAAATGTYAKVRIMAPFTMISKREIALRGKKAGVDFTETWSCYKGGKVHCGTCGTCVERKEALAGFDETKYLGGK